MTRCNGTLECAKLQAILALAALALVMLAGCSFLSGNGGGNGSGLSQNAKEAEMGEDGSANAAGVESAQTHLASGKAAYSDVRELDISVANGSLICRSDDLAPGEVAFEWTYHNGTGGKPHAANYELRHKLKDHRLVILDWRDPLKSWLGNDSAKLDLTVRHGPDVVISEANLGNGDMLADGVIGGSLNVGNGSLDLRGELISDSDLNIGNGDVTGNVLVRKGDHSVNVGNGSVALQLRPQSSIALSATVAVGSIEALPEFAVSRSHLVGASASGNLGDGVAALSVNIGNGSLELKSAEEAS